MSTHREINIPEQLWKQAQNMVDQGWVNNMDSLITESMRRYIASHQKITSETFIREDVLWDYMVTTNVVVIADARLALMMKRNNFCILYYALIV